MWCEHSPLTLGTGSRPVDAICGLSFVAGSFPCFESFFFRVLYCTVMRSGIVDEEPLCGCAASISYSFIHSFIHSFIYLFMVVN